MRNFKTKVTILISLVLSITLVHFPTNFSSLFNELMEKSPEILSKKLEYESYLTNEEKDESKLLNAELEFNRTKCNELKDLVSMIYDYNISQLEFKKYTLLINLSSSSKDVDESPGFLNFKLKSTERKKEELIKEIEILLDAENLEPPGLVNLETVDISLVFLDEGSLLNMSLVKEILELKDSDSDSALKVLQKSAERRKLRLKLVDRLFDLRNSFDLLNLYRTTHNDFTKAIDSIEKDYRSGKISNEDYINSQLKFVELKIKLLSQEKDFILRYLDILELLGLDVEKYFNISTE